jgi:hypothetical protein
MDLIKKYGKEEKLKMKWARALPFQYLERRWRRRFSRKPGRHRAVPFDQ